MSKKVKAIGFVQVMKRIKQAGLQHSPPPNRADFELNELDPIEKRVAQLFNIVECNQSAGNMIYFVMYDIEDNKVRVQVSKYLIKKGCQRIQKSIFLANEYEAGTSTIVSTIVQVILAVLALGALYLLVRLFNQEAQRRRMISEQENLEESHWTSYKIQSLIIK